jgi:hypothetical protein
MFPPAPAQQPQGSTAKIDKMAAKIMKIGVRADVTVKLYNGKTLHGFINRIEDQEFEISEVDLKTSLVIRYNEVKRVESGYGPKNLLGNRSSKKGRCIGTIIGIAALAVPFVIIAVSIRE